MHKGQIIRRVVEDYNVNKSKLADKLNISRQTLYNIFSSEQVAPDVILEIGRIIHHDFSEEIKQLKRYVIHDAANLLEEENADYWRNKYIELLEEYNKLLKAKKK